MGSIRLDRGHLDAYLRAIARLESEKREIDQRLLNTPTPIEVSPKRLRPLVADRVTDLKETFAGDHRAGHTQRDKRAA